MSNKGRDFAETRFAPINLKFMNEMFISSHRMSSGFDSKAKTSPNVILSSFKQNVNDIHSKCVCVQSKDVQIPSKRSPIQSKRVRIHSKHVHVQSN